MSDEPSWTLAGDIKAIFRRPDLWEARKRSLTVAPERGRIGGH